MSPLLRCPTLLAMTTVHLYGLHYSPWTERARWALEHHRIRYRFHAHVPFLGESLLRFRGRRLKQKKVSVPLLVAGKTTIGDSFEIIQHADRVGRGSTLIADAEAAQEFAARIETGLQAARANVTANILGDDEALREAAMAASPAFAAGALRPLAALGARYIAKKYDADLQLTDQHRATIADVLRELRTELDGAEFMNGKSLSALDMLAASLLQGVSPVADRFIELGPATRRAWTIEPLAEEFSDLIVWRDRLYAEHR